MKTILTMILSAFLFVSAFAQTVTLTFRGNNQNRDYRVLIDGNSYSSVNATSNGNGQGTRSITITNLSPGTHSVAIYNTTNANGNVNSNGSLVYSNNFQLRSDYDMLIGINGNRVAFSEKIAQAADASNTLGTSAMASADFAQLLQEVRNSRYQSARVAAIREAVATTDRFTTSQLRQLFSLVTNETTRLDLAKLSYRVVTDPENYTRLNTLFTTQANRNNLASYVQLNANVNTGTSLPVNSTVRGLLSAGEYDQILRNLNNNNYQSGKYNLVRDAFANPAYAFTTAQIRQLLGVVTSEPDRLYLAKQAYSTVYDPANFSSLLTLFASQSNRTDLNNYIISNGGTGGNVYVSTRIPMSDASFSQLLKSAGNHVLPWDKVKDVRAAFSDPQNNFTSSQTRQLLYLVSSGNLLSVNEATRLELAKLSYPRVTDPENFVQVVDLFTDQNSRNELNSYIRLQVQN